jgi:hypothetical protein
LVARVLNGNRSKTLDYRRARRFYCVDVGGAALTSPFTAGILQAIGSGIVAAVGRGDASSWYSNGAQISPNELCAPKPQCDESPWQDVLRRAFYEHAHSLCAAGQEFGVDLWNAAMGNGLVRLIFPFLFAATVTALIKRAVDKAWPQVASASARRSPERQPKRRRWLAVPRAAAGSIGRVRRSELAQGCRCQHRPTAASHSTRTVR